MLIVVIIEEEWMSRRVDLVEFDSQVIITQNQIPTIYN